MLRSRTQGRKLNWKVIPGVISFQVTAAAINLDEIAYLMRKGGMRKAEVQECNTEKHKQQFCSGRP